MIGLSAKKRLELSRRMGPRETLRLALGGLWLLDGALQLQPYMLSRSFAAHVLEPAAAGNPAWVAGPVLWAARIVGAHPALDLLFGLVQLAIGGWLLSGRYLRGALAVSILWATVVWYLGEGLGGVLTATASPFTGAPGAAVLYALLALAVWPTSPRAAKARDLAVGLAWAALCGYLAALALTPHVALNVSAAEIFEARELHAAGHLGPYAARVAESQALASGEPAAIAAIDGAIAHIAPGGGGLIALAYGAVFALAALLPFWAGRLRRVGIVLFALAIALLWLGGENLGGLLTGSATDPNSGPLLIALLALWWPEHLRLPLPAPLLRRGGARQARAMPI